MLKQMGIDWIFSGIGTSVLLFFLGLGGGYTIHKIKLKLQNKQVQKAGDNSQQFQVSNFSVNNIGIDECRVREIINESQIRLLKESTAEAYHVVNERIQTFSESLMPVIKRHEENLSFFADPSFQSVLRKAQISAAKSDRGADYDMLASLLDEHIKNKEDRTKCSAIEMAIDIVDKVDSQALCALSVVYLVQEIVPGNMSIIGGLNYAEEMFKNIITFDLPKGKKWLDHLDVLGMVRNTTIATIIDFNNYYLKRFNGYICVGIPNGSEKYHNALNILKEANIDTKFLMPHELLEGYARLGLTHLSIDEYSFFSQNQKEAIKEVVGLYSTDHKCMSEVKERFLKKWNSFENIHKVQTWWNNIPNSFEITGIGKMLAMTYLRRLDPSFPMIEI